MFVEIMNSQRVQTPSQKFFNLNLSMDFNISFGAPTNQQALSYSQSFRKHLHLGDFDGKLKATQEREVLQPDEAGGLLSSILNLQLSEEVALDFVRSLGGWIKRPKPNHVSITIATPSGNHITIQGDKLAEDGGEMLHRILQVLRSETPVKSEESWDVNIIRRRCKDLIAKADTAKVFSILAPGLKKPTGFPENDFLLLQNQWHQIEKEYLLGLATKEEIFLVKAKVNYALLDLLDQMT